MFWAFWSTGASMAQCTGCTQTLILNTGTLVLLDNSVICISFNGTYTGTINMNNRSGVTICVSSNTTIGSAAQFQNPSGGFNVINHGIWNKTMSVENGRTFTNENGGSLTAAITINNGGQLTNRGSWTSTPSLVGGTVVNTGTASFSSAFNPTSGNWTGSGSVSISSFSPNGGTFTFGGPTTISGAVAIASGPSVTFNGTTSVGSNLTVNSSSTLQLGNSISVAGNVTIQGTLHVTTSAPTCMNFCPSGTFSNTGSITAETGKTLQLCKAPGGTLGTGVSVLLPPSSQPSALNISLAGASVNGSFVAAAGSPPGYMVLVKNSAFSMADFPVFGNTYNVGQSVGAAKVVALVGGGTSFSSSIDGCGTVHYAVLTMSNSSASCAAYNTASPLIGTVEVSSVGGTVINGFEVCAGDAMQEVVLTGFVGDVTNWEVSTVADFSSSQVINGTVLAFTPPANDGIRYYRAWVKAGACSALPSVAAMVNVRNPSVTTWSGSVSDEHEGCDNWSAGRPSAASSVFVNGGANRTLRLTSDLTVANFTFGQLNPSTASIDLNGRTLTVTGTLELATNSNLNISNGTLELRGSIVGSGQLTCNGTGNIIISGSGPLGSLAFSPGTTLNNLTLNRASQALNLASGVTVAGSLTVQAGTLAVGAQELTANGPLSISGTLSTTANSSISIGGSGSITGFVMPTSLAGFTLNRPSATISLAGNTVIGGVFQLLEGTLAVGARTLTLNGNITGGGTLSTTTSSNLNIGGSGIITSFFVPSVLNNLTLNRAAAEFQCDQDVTISGDITMTAGFVKTGTHVMTMSTTSNLSGETNTAQVHGFLRTTRNAGLLGSSFGGLGFSFATGLQNVGNATITRHSGPGSAILNGTFKSISTVYNVEITGSQPTLGRICTLNWLEANDNGNNFGLLRCFAWRKKSTSSPWERLDLNLPITVLGQNRSATFTTDHFSDYTVADWDNPLPVVLASFTTKWQNGNAVLRWVTQQELNNRGFVIERSAAGFKWDSVGFVSGQGNTQQRTQYEFEVPEPNTNYYRLRQVDLDGSCTPTYKLLVQAPRNGWKPMAYPNPSLDGQLNWRFLAGEAEMTLRDAAGKVVLVSTVDANTPQSTDLPAGVYQYELKQGDVVWQGKWVRN